MHLFYAPDLSKGFHQLDEDETRHCTKVLRHTVGDDIHITDGKGILAKGRITGISKKNVTFEVKESTLIPAVDFAVHLYIAPTKSTDRMEWMVEKLCELGVADISFISSQNSERNKMRMDRLEKKAVSALKQSKGAWMTSIHPLIDIKEAFKNATGDLRLIASVTDDIEHLMNVIQPKKSVDIFIGPEGDFTDKEVAQAISLGFLQVSLGKKVLRTETAGLYACSGVHLINKA